MMGPSRDRGSANKTTDAAAVRPCGTASIEPRRKAGNKGDEKKKNQEEPNNHNAHLDPKFGQAGTAKLNRRVGRADL